MSVEQEEGIRASSDWQQWLSLLLCTLIPSSAAFSWLALSFVTSNTFLCRMCSSYHFTATRIAARCDKESIRDCYRWRSNELFCRRGKRPIPRSFLSFGDSSGIRSTYVSLDKLEEWLLMFIALSPIEPFVKLTCDVHYQTLQNACHRSIAALSVDYKCEHCDVWPPLQNRNVCSVEW